MMLEAYLVRGLRHFTVDVALRCETGHCLCLTGESGSGKTTILRMLAGLERPDSGHIRHGGRIWYSRGTELKARHRNVGYLSQDYPLFPHLNLWKNVLFQARDKEGAEGWLRRFGLWDKRRSRVSTLSGGERQRGALAQILAREPGLLLLDEGFSALDHGTRALMHQAVRDIKQSMPVVMVTHDPQESSLLGDLHLHIHRGVAVGPGQRDAGTFLQEQSPAFGSGGIMLPESTPRQ